MNQDVAIRPLRGAAEMAQAEALQHAVERAGEIDVLPARLLLTLAQNGGVVLGAFDAESLVGLVVGFLGTDRESPDRVAMARLKHCSHLLAVLPHYRGLGIGFQLKCAQRQAVIRQGIRLVTWSYDPLVSLHAQLSIRRLGALCRSYRREAAPESLVLHGGPSDRFEVEWWVTSSRVATRLEGARRPLELAHFLEAGVAKLNPTSLGADGLPRPPETPAALQGNLALVEIPPDYAAIESRDPALAQAWRLHARALFEHAFRAGYLVTDFVHLSGERFPRSYYLLSHGEGTLG